MHPIQRRFFLVLSAAAFAVLSHQSAVAISENIGDGAKIGPPSAFTPNSQEYYLSADQIAWIRPGLNITILGVTDLAPGKKPVVEFTITDDLKQPLDRLGATTPGPVSVSFILAKWNPTTRYYVPYTFRTRNGVTNPSADQGGTFTEVAIGRYKYTFGTTLPADMDVAATNTLGAYGSRNMSGILEKNYYAPNVFQELRADGGTPAAVWSAMNTTATCNRCHDPLAEHGGSRRDAKNCMLCHNASISKDATSGETFDGKVLFHKLHRGKDLPSVVGGKPYIAGADYSTVAYPQDIRNCETCHQTTATEASIWYTRPTRAVCGSCHDNINWTTGENHCGGLPQISDLACKNCHGATMNAEFDISVKGAHVIPVKSTQLKGLKATIVSVTNFVPGQKPTATFKVTNGDGTAVNATKLNSFSPILAGPTADYKAYWRESGLATGVFDAATGNTAYTFTNPIPADAVGTWTVSLDAYRNVSLVRGDGTADTSVRECATNPIWYGAIKAGEPVVNRRSVASMALCNRCHDQLALHGGQRLVMEECVICHNPLKDDRNQRPAGNGDPESVDMKRMIHRIHTGEELAQDFTVYGNGQSRHNYNEVRYPGDRRNCSACHTGSTYNLPPGGNLETPTPRDYMSVQGPGTTSCTGCHDSKDHLSHANINTSKIGESCAVCHGPNSEWSVSKSHSR
ncbi:MAG: OmcA/MtrC family decaheme c-type cytochrome [Thermoanaerobaculia bacterium]|nr:OmcA/MtrC family decaheme c-type cytochrome [Thermoanaerobaculia bacterium]